MAAGKSDEEIFQHMVDRYGDYVLYKPPLVARTWLLWGAPILLLVGGAAIAVFVIARKSHLPDTDPPIPAWVPRDRFHHRLRRHDRGGSAVDPAAAVADPIAGCRCSLKERRIPQSPSQCSCPRWRRRLPSLSKWNWKETDAALAREQQMDDLLEQAQGEAGRQPE